MDSRQHEPFFSISKSSVGEKDVSVGGPEWQAVSGHIGLHTSIPVLDEQQTMDTPPVSLARQVFSLGRRMGKEDVRGLQVHKSRT